MTNGRFYQEVFNICSDLFQSFLAYVDLLGTTYTASTIATGYGAYIALPLLRTAVEGRENTLTEEEARKVLEDALRVLFYRDARSLDKVCSRRDYFLMYLDIDDTRSIKLQL